MWKRTTAAAAAKAAVTAAAIAARGESGSTEHSTQISRL
jgi:2-methylcitrate dehydratase PrpD